MVNYHFFALCAVFISTCFAQNTMSGAPSVGSTISLLFLNATQAPLTAHVQRYEAQGQTTYLVNCALSDANTCGIHDATVSIVQGKTYDFHTAVNSGGALTIHCTFESDGTTPSQCTRTVAGGPDGYEVSTTKPTAAEWAYLPVKITKTALGVNYQASGTTVMPSATASPFETSSATPTSVSQALADANAARGRDGFTRGTAVALALMMLVSLQFACL